MADTREPEAGSNPVLEVRKSRQGFLRLYPKTARLSKMWAQAS